MSVQAGKILILAGVVLLILGGIMLLGGRLPFLGKLPGDISINRGQYRIELPVTTSILLSLLLSGILWILSLFTKK